jgi:diphosphate--fructose-6-phosphate 1-phosphotransferase
MELSQLQKARYLYQPKLSPIFQEDMEAIEAVKGAKTASVSDCEKIAALFPNTYGMEAVTFKKGSSAAPKRKEVVGVILSGGQAPGGHNVIAGLFDALKKANKDNVLIGFKNGPSGLIDDDFIELTEDYVAQYRNTGGFDIIASGRTKLETEEQFEIATKVCKKHGITAIVIIGGDDSNTNAAMLAEYFAKHKTGVQVIGCPKTIDGDLKNDSIEISFGFDTATKTYSELIGNIEKDANSARKYWHLVKVMGRSASHIALECAFQCQPNICIIGEEVAAREQSLASVVNEFADVVEMRSNDGNNFGVAIIPEGLIEFIPEIKSLIAELNDTLALNQAAFDALEAWEAKRDFVLSKLTAASKATFTFLPEGIQKQLLSDRDPHGNVQVSKIETEQLISELVAKELKARKAKGTYNGKFSALHHFFGYEGRCAFPSNFDSDYCYNLGYTAYMLIANGCTGYIASIKNLKKAATEWIVGGIPITAMMNLEQRNGKMKPVIQKALVKLDGVPFKTFAANRARWAKGPCFTFPGAIQYFGPSEVCDQPTVTLTLEHQD